MLHYRIGTPADGPWTVLPPTGGDPEVRAWAQRHLEFIEQRIDHLTDQAGRGQAHWLPEHLRRPTGDEHAEADWFSAVRIVVAYRDQYAIAGTDPLGPRPDGGRAVHDYDRGAAALARMERATRLAPRPESVSVGAQTVDQHTAAERIRHLRKRGQEDGSGSNGPGLSSVNNLRRLAAAAVSSRTNATAPPASRSHRSTGPLVRAVLGSDSALTCIDRRMRRDAHRMGD